MRCMLNGRRLLSAKACYDGTFSSRIELRTLFAFRPLFAFRTQSLPYQQSMRVMSAVEGVKRSLIVSTSCGGPLALIAYHKMIDLRF